MSKDNNKDQFTIDDILNESYSSGEDYSLESILSEYKGSAFIQGEKKTPSDELDRKVSDILKGIGVNAPKSKIDEVVSEEIKLEKAEAKPAKRPEPEKKPEPEPEAPVKEPEPAKKRVIDIAPAARPEPEPAVDEPEEDVKTWTPAPKADPKPINKPGEDEVADFFKNYSEDDDRYFSSKEFSKKVADELDKQGDYSYSEPEKAKKEEAYEDFDEEKPSLMDKLLSKFKKSEDYEEPDSDDAEKAEEKPSFFAGLLSKFSSREDYEEENEEEEEEEEPDFDAEMARLSQPVPMLTIRSYIAAAIVIIMAIFTFIFEADNPLPFGL